MIHTFSSSASASAELCNLSRARRARIVDSSEVSAAACGSTTAASPAPTVHRNKGLLWFSLVAAAVVVLFAQLALAVPGNEADPPMPPSDFGNLFDDGRPRIHDCRIDRIGSNASRSTIRFRSNYPFNRARFLNTSSTWSSWTSLSANEYVCTAPNCLWFGGQVEIRGCTDSAGTNCPSACIVTVGKGAGGRPIVEPAGLPKPIANHVGCAQSDHTELSFIARWTGAAATGYPRVRDSGGNPIPLTRVSGSTSGGVFTGTYTIPAGWSVGFEGTWSFEFLIDTGRTHLVNVQVGEHCLNAPRVYQVDTGGTRTEVFDGSMMFVGPASRMVIETGNVGLTLTNHVLDPATQTLGSVFNLTQPTPGTIVTESWSEAANGWDSRAYTSPDVDIGMTASALTCVNDGTHRFWLNPPSPSVNLPTSTTATTVATVQTDACSGIVGTAPVITPANRHSILGTIAVTWNVLTGNEVTGWVVQATPALANGMISDAATFSGTGWPVGGETISVSRAGATTCPAGERVVAGICEPCPTYQVCSGGGLSSQEWCNAGNPPASDFMDSYEVCQAGTTQVVNQCFTAGSTVPADAPCPGTCPPAPPQPSCAMGEEWVWLDATASPPCGAWDRQLVSYPILGSCETAAWDSSSCSYTEVNSAGPEPAPGVCETVSLDTLLCNWEVTYTGGTPPPVGACETASLDPNTCTWSVVDTADAEPSVGACFSTSFDTNTCTWSVTDNTPSPPGYACGDVFDAASCTYSEAAAPAAPGYACGDVFDSASCSWSEAPPPSAPGYACGDVFDAATCTYSEAAAPQAPATSACFSASFDSSSCTWSVSDDTPPAPSTTACESASFDSVSCSWTVVDNTPSPPGYACGDVFDAASCSYSAAPPPSAPGYACGDVFNSATCSWSEAAAPPAPGYACGDVFDSASCSWSAAPAPSAPSTTACESASFDSASCTWTVVDNTPSEPSVGACFSTSFNAGSCSWTVTDNTPDAPGNACGDVFDAATCSYSAAPAPPAPGYACGDVFDAATCSWSAGPAPSPPPTSACESASFDSASCSWTVVDNTPPEPSVGPCFSTSFDAGSCTWLVVDNTPPEPSLGACFSASFNAASCSWTITDNTPEAPGNPCGDRFDAASCSYLPVSPPEAPGNACGDVFNAATCSWSAAPAPSAPSTTACESASFDSASCSWTVLDNTPSEPSVGACFSTSFNAASCSWTVTDNTPDAPGYACGDVFDSATCSYSPAPAPSAPGYACGDVFDAATCSWSAASPPNPPTGLGACESPLFDAVSCSYSVVDNTAQPPPCPDGTLQPDGCGWICIKDPPPCDYTSQPVPSCDVGSFPVWNPGLCIWECEIHT